MQRIDLRHILRHTVSDLYGDLVTRPTGKAVRHGIEQALARADGRQVAVIDFSTVRCLDISCADEIVGKLLIEHGAARMFVLSGVTDAHCEAIAQVLERHGTAVVARDRNGRIEVLGPVDETARLVFQSLAARGAAALEQIAADGGIAAERARAALEELCARGVVLRNADGYAVVQ